MASTMVTVFPVPGLEGGSDGGSGRLSVKHVRAKDTERGRARRKLQDGRNGLKLCSIACDVHVVHRTLHPEDARANDRTEVFSGREQDPVLIEHGVHRLVLPTNWVPIELKPSRKILLKACHSE